MEKKDSQDWRSNLTDRLTPPSSELNAGSCDPGRHNRQDAEMKSVSTALYGLHLHIDTSEKLHPSPVVLGLMER